MNTRQRLYQRYLSTNELYDKNRYIRFRIKLNDVIRLSKMSYYPRMLETNRTNLKKTWSILNQLLGKNTLLTLPSFKTQ